MQVDYRDIPLKQQDKTRMTIFILLQLPLRSSRRYNH